MGKVYKKLSQNKKDNKDIEQVINALETVIDNEFISNSSCFENDLTSIVNRLKDNDFKVAVVGEFSSGKSTFLNALLGKDILKHGARETTATITEIDNVTSDKDTDVFDVIYTDGTTEKSIPLDKLLDYTATTSSTHEVAQEIEKVIIKSNVLESDYPVSFIDTPGLNGVADNHREKTIEQIKNAHACIYLLQVRGLGQSDIDFIKYISKYQKNFIFVQNFIDELKNIECETPEGKVAEQNKILSQQVFNEQDNVEFKIVGVSARKALIARDINIKTYDGCDLSEEGREKLYDSSKFDGVLDEISSMMNKNKKENMQQHDAILAASGILKQLLDILTYQNEEEKKEWEMSPEARQLRGYEKIIKELQDNKQSYKKNISNFIEAESDSLRKQVNKKIAADLEKLESIAADEINAIKTVDSFEDYMNNHKLTNLLNKGIDDVKDDCNKYMNAGFENIICNAILRIKDYTGSNARKAKLSSFKTKNLIVKEYENFSQDENEIQQMEKEIAEKRTALNKTRDDKRSIAAQVKDLSDKIQDNNNKTYDVEKNRNSKLRILGSEPEPVTRYHNETHYVDRAFGFLTKILGKKAKTVSVPYPDYAKQNEWKAKKSNIENEYNRDKERINAEARLLNDKLNQCNEDIRYLDKLEPSKQREIETMQTLLSSKIQNIKARKEKAQREYLRNLKMQVMDDIKNYLYVNENIKECLLEIFETAFVENKRRVSDIVIKLFDLSFEERIRMLSNLQNKINGEPKSFATDKAISTIKNTMTILEGRLCQIYKAQN